MSGAQQGRGADGLQRPLFDEMCSLTTLVATSRISQNEGILLANLFHRYKAEISAELFQASVPSKK